MICKILLTGASGFIGKNFLSLCKKKNYQILAISRKKQKNKENVKWLKSDFGKLNLSHLNKIKEFQPKVIIHLGWQDIPTFTKKVSEMNLKKSKNFLNNLIHLKSLKKIIITGSCFEYLKKQGSVNEKNKLDRISFLSKAKINLQLFSKKLCFANNKMFYWLRPFYIYGPYQRSDSLIPYLVKKILTNSKIQLNNPYKNLDYVYVDDVVKLIDLFVRQNINEGIYNIGTGEKTSLIEIYNYLQLKIKKKYSLNKLSRTDYFISNNNKLNKNIGKYKFINITKGLDKYLLSLKKNDFS